MAKFVSSQIIVHENDCHNNIERPKTYAFNADKKQKNLARRNRTADNAITTQPLQSHALPLSYRELAASTFCIRMFYRIGHNNHSLS